MPQGIFKKLFQDFFQELFFEYFQELHREASRYSSGVSFKNDCMYFWTIRLEMSSEISEFHLNFLKKILQKYLQKLLMHFKDSFEKFGKGFLHSYFFFFFHEFFKKIVFTFNMDFCINSFKDSFFNWFCGSIRYISLEFFKNSSEGFLWVFFLIYIMLPVLFWNNF